MEHFTAFDNPDEWDRASHNHLPIDDLEPEIVRVSAYREAALRGLRLLLIIDTFV
jgi:hypothetical protein